MSKKPFVVGITGGTCSGKSTLSDLLEDRLKVQYKVIAFHMDHYFLQPAPMTVAPITRIEYMERNHPDSIDLNRLYSDFTTAVEDQKSDQADIIIIEGLFSLYLDRIRESLDLKIFVDLKSDERLVRRITRFIKWEQSIEKITNRYLDSVRFRHDEFVEPTRGHADMVINGTLDTNKGTEVLLNYLESQLSARQ